MQAMDPDDEFMAQEWRNIQQEMRFKQTHKGKYNCKLCGEQFYTSRQFLVNHMSLMHGIQPEKNVKYKCRECGVRFTYKAHLRTHLKVYHDFQDVFKCLGPGCLKHFSKTESLYAHYRREHPDFPKPNKEMGRAVSWRSVHPQHLPRHWESKPAKALNASATKTEHTTQNTSVKAEPKTQITSVIATESEEEIVLETPEKHVFQCLGPDCYKYFSQTASLYNHYRRAHCDFTKTFKEMGQAVPWQSVPLQLLPSRRKKSKPKEHLSASVAEEKPKEEIWVEKKRKPEEQLNSSVAKEKTKEEIVVDSQEVFQCLGSGCTKHYKYSGDVYAHYRRKHSDSPKTFNEMARTVLRDSVQPQILPRRWIPVKHDSAVTSEPKEDIELSSPVTQDVFECLGPGCVKHFRFVANLYTHYRTVHSEFPKPKEGMARAVPWHTVQPQLLPRRRKLGKPQKFRDPQDVFECLGPGCVKHFRFVANLYTHYRTVHSEFPKPKEEMARAVPWHTVQPQLLPRRRKLGNPQNFRDPQDVFECLGPGCLKHFRFVTSLYTHYRRAHPDFPKTTEEMARAVPWHSVHPQLLPKRLKKKKSQKKKIVYYRQPDIVLRTKKFNCYDCEASFETAHELFQHCRIHRFLPDGSLLRYLLQPRVNKNRMEVKGYTLLKVAESPVND